MNRTAKIEAEAPKRQQLPPQKTESMKSNTGLMIMTSGTQSMTQGFKDGPRKPLS